MSDSLVALEQQRASILAQIQALGDFRSGSITAIQGQCGKANCRCHQPDQPGHGPNYQLTAKGTGIAWAAQRLRRRAAYQSANEIATDRSLSL